MNVMERTIFGFLVLIAVQLFDHNSADAQTGACELQDSGVEVDELIVMSFDRSTGNIRISGSGTLTSTEVNCDNADFVCDIGESVDISITAKYNAGSDQVYDTNGSGNVESPRASDCGDAGLNCYLDDYQVDVDVIINSFNPHNSGYIEDDDTTATLSSTSVTCD